MRKRPLPFILLVLALSGAALGCSRTLRAERPVPVDEDPSWGGLEVLEAGGGDAALVFLHGHGGTAENIFEFAQELASPRMHVVVPSAPLELAQGRAWFSLEGVVIQGDIRNAEPEGLDAASEQVLGVVKTLERRGFRRECIALAGFSQGAVVAVDAATRRPGLAGVGVFSGALIAERRWSQHWRGLPFFIAHGRQDSQLPFAYGEALHASLEAAGHAHTFVPFEGDHYIPPQVWSDFVRHLRSWVHSCHRTPPSHGPEQPDEQAQSAALRGLAHAGAAALGRGA